MSSKSNTKKSKNTTQKILQNLPSPNNITLKLISGNIDYIKSSSDSILFKTYLLSNLLNKSLQIGQFTELDFLNTKLKFQIVNATFPNPEEIDKNLNEINFSLTPLSEIIIDKSENQINTLINEMETKLNLNEEEKKSQNIDELSEENKKLLKNILEEKLNSNNSKSKFNPNIKYSPINYEEIYKKIESMLNFYLFQNGINNENKHSDLLICKEKKDNYMHKGIILCGNSGIGKTHLLNCIKANYLIPKNITFFDIDIYKNLQQSPEKNISFITSIFIFSKLLSPTVIFFENLDILFPNTNSSGNEDNSNNFSISSNNSEITPLLAELINQIQEMPSNVFILSSCEMPSRINNKLTKLGFLDYNIILPLPNFIQRKNLIENISKDFKNTLSQEEIDNLADKSHGFVPGDFVKLFKEAYIHTELNTNDGEKIITKNILDICIGNIKPINLKDIIIDIPKVKWEDIGGNKQIIQKIRQSIEWPLKNPTVFKRLGVIPPNGTLLYGPPGCSKTLIAKALATESGLNFFAVKGPELFSKYVGDTEKAVRDVFKKARMSAPSIIFFDEIDAMASSRSSESSGVEDKVLCQLLNEMDGIEGRDKVIIFGATNRPDILDKALIRPGRFDRLIFIPPPDQESREEIFRVCLKKMKIKEGLDYKKLAEKTEMFSGADIAKVSREAGMMAIADNIECEFVDEKFIEKAIETTKPIITKEMIKYFEDFAKKSEE